MDDTRNALTAAIDNEADDLVAFLSHLAATPSPNPPGDTRAAAAVLSDALEASVTKRVDGPKRKHGNIPL